MADTDWAISACRRIKKAMFFLCRYPLFSAQYIRDYIDQPHTEPRELQDYRENLMTSKRLRALLLVSIYAFYTLKNLYVLYAWAHSFDYEDYQDNLKPLGYDQQQLLSQMNYSSPGHTLKHISCLYTNCTRLGPPEAQVGANKTRPAANSLALLKDVGRLPMMSLCHPTLERIYSTPATKMGAFGILCFLITMYTHFLLGSWTTIQQALLPATNDLIMSITSPKVTHKVMRLRTCELLRDLALSLQNYRLFSIWNRANGNVDSELMLAPTDGDFASCAPAKNANSAELSELQYRFNWRPSHLRQMPLSLEPPHGSTKRETKVTSKDPLVGSDLRQIYFKGRSERYIGRAIDNCMPLVSTEWWRPHLARIWSFVFIEMLLACVLIAISCLGYVAWRVSSIEASVQEFARQMDSGNCFVWLETASKFAPGQALPVDKLNYKWDLFSLLDAFTLNFTGGVTAMMLYSNYWSLIMHISVWLAEVRMFIVASLLASRFQHQRDRLEAERDFRDPDRQPPQVDPLAGSIGRLYLVSTRQFYNVPNLRQQFKDSTRVRYILAYNKIRRRDKWTHNSSAYQAGQSTAPAVHDYHLLNSKHSDRNYADRFLAEILFPLPANIRHPDQSGQLFDKIEYDIETMEQIYVNFRLLINYVRGLNSAIRLLMIIAYLLNYGYILVSIICRRKFSDLNNETIFLCLAAFAITNYVIFLSADFHANAKQVQPLLWSLIAQLTYSKNLRLRHLRSLWIKQTIDLDSEGGLALTVYGVPITYVFIIQLVIWTATIFVLALKPHAQDA